MAKDLLKDDGFSYAQIDMTMAKRKLLWMLRQMQPEALKRIAALVAEKAKERVPVRSGCLRDSIKGRVRKVKNQDALMATVSTNTRGKVKKVTKQIQFRTKKGEDLVMDKATYTTVKYGYGLDVEIGRPSGNYSSTPYLRPALGESYPEIQRIFQEEFAKGAVRANGQSMAPAAMYSNNKIPVLGREILTGKKGGRYYINDNGKRTYVK